MKKLYFQGFRLNWVDITSRKGGRIKMQSIETSKTVLKILKSNFLALMSTLYMKNPLNTRIMSIMDVYPMSTQAYFMSP